MEVVAVLGASNDKSRYSYMAMQLLKQYGHRPIPIHHMESEVLGFPVVKSVAELAQGQEKIDTLTMYVGPALSSKFADDIIKLNPKRVIFNPGSENAQLEERLKKNGVTVEEACTLVLLRTNQF